MGENLFELRKRRQKEEEEQELFEELTQAFINGNRNYTREEFRKLRRKADNRHIAFIKYVANNHNVGMALEILYHCDIK